MERRLARLLRFYRAVGIRELFVPPERMEEIRGMRAEERKEAELRTLADVQRAWAGCERCRLSRTRTHLVFGEGSETADLLFVGEGPGRDEDRLGRPFVGKAGELLTRIIRAMGLTREEVYITNVVKCRPPRNRNPFPDEIQACNPALQAQIRILEPRVICALGAVAARTLLQTEAPITALRGRFHSWNGIQVMPTYHPAFLLRNPGKKREVWEDMQQIMEVLDIPPSHRKGSPT